MIKNKFFLACLLIFLAFESCTDLETEELTNSPENLDLTNAANPDQTITGLYSSLGQYIEDQAHTYALNEVTTDEMIVPSRGVEWNDNGIWRELHEQTWQVDHDFVNTTWEQWTEFQCLAASIFDPDQNPTTEERGQGHFLRALASFYLLDNFGQLPICDSLSGDPSPVLTGEDAVNFILSDLESAEAFLQNNAPGVNNSRAGISAAAYLHAKVLLNAHVYRGNTPDNSDMTLVQALVNTIQSNGYGIEEGFFDIFKEDVDAETILFLGATVGTRMWNTLHYNQAPEIAGGGWNGFATLSEFYDLFEGPGNTNWPNQGQEERRGFTATQGLPYEGLPGTTESVDFPGFTAGSNIGFGFLFGQQYDIDCTALQDRLGNPLDFGRFFVDQDGNSNLSDNSETTGIRVLKYNPQFGGFTNHLLYFRFSDAHLMRAEAMFRGGAVGDALVEINELRTLRGAEALGALTEQDIIDERARELYTETWRRNDLIRFERFNDQWELKDPSAIGNTNRNVFPIPTAALTSNPNLQQNPGY